LVPETAKINGMRNLLCAGLLVSARLFAQDAPAKPLPDNAAIEALKKRLLDSNLLNPPKPIAPVNLTAPAVPKVCSIPLLNVKPPGTRDQMTVVKPPVSPGPASRGDIVQVPAPPCSSADFRNK
jgi:hypothetical protein